MQDAAWKGRARGSRPGLVDTRGTEGQSRAIQHALRAADPCASSDDLATLLRAVLADGNPLADTITLFDLAPPANGIVGER